MKAPELKSISPLNRLVFCCWLCFFSAGVVPAQASSEIGRAEKNDDRRRIFSLTLENDLVAGMDDNYTNGVRFSFLSAVNDVPHFIRRTVKGSGLFPEDGKTRIEYTIGQNMYTPADIETRNPPLNDRPYAGWLYGSVGLVSENGRHLHQLELKLGVIGPSSYADEAQTFIHRNLSNSPEPAGWHTQLPDEPVIQLTYQASWPTYKKIGFPWLKADLMPTFSLAVGTVFDYLEGGFIVRLGNRLLDDYGPPKIQPSPPGSSYFASNSDLFNWYLFAGANGRLVAHNIFLDGTVFKDSRQVDKHYGVADLIVGVNMVIGATYRLTYTHVFRTPEFEGQSGLERYGSLTLSVAF